MTKWLVSPSFYIPVCLGAASLFLMPESALNSSSVLETYTSFVSGYMPLINEHASNSTFPSVMSLYLSITWPLYALQIPTICRYVMAHDEIEIVNRYKTGKKLTFGKILNIPFKYWAPFMGVIGECVFIAGFYLGKDPSFCTGCTNANTLGAFLLWSFGVPMAFGYIFANQIVWFKNFKKIYFDHQGEING